MPHRSTSFAAPEKIQTVRSVRQKSVTGETSSRNFLTVSTHGFLVLPMKGLLVPMQSLPALVPPWRSSPAIQRVEKASGEVVTLREYLEQVWAAVAKEALSLVFRDADASGLEPDARLTAMWLWTLKTTPNGTDSGKATLDTEDEDVGDEEDDDSPTKPAKGGFSLEFDAARKIAQGLGAHLEDLTSVVEVKGQTARLLPVGERVKALFGKDQGKAPSTPRKSRGRAGFLKGMEDVSVPRSGDCLPG